MNFIGISTRLCADGNRHPYLASLQIDGRRRTSLIALPSTLRYLTPPAHPIYGDLTKGAPIDKVINAIRNHLAGREAVTHVDNKGLPLLDQINIHYEEAPSIDIGEEAHNQIEALEASQNRKSSI